MRGCRECFLGGSAMGGFARGSRSPRGCGGKTRHSFSRTLWVRCFALWWLPSFSFGHTCQSRCEPSPRVGCFGSTRGEGSVDAGVVQSLSNGDTDAETVSFILNFLPQPRAASRPRFIRHASTTTPYLKSIIYTPLFISDSSLHFRDVYDIHCRYSEHPTKRGMSRG